jgi:diaminobutyrate-2-oxoglutarate transaminase
MLRTRMFASSSTAAMARHSSMGFDKEGDYQRLAAQLESRGTPVTSHVLQSGPEASSNASKCPWLSSDDVLLRCVQRESSARTYSRRFPIDIKRAKGSWIEDTSGRKWLDSLMCAGTLALGHNHDVAQNAIRRFVESEQPMQTLDLLSPLKDQFVSELFASMPAQFASDARVQFCGPAGTDCVEAAIKLAKRATGRAEMASFFGGYHGHTAGALALMGNLDAKSAQPNLMPGVHFFPFPYAYRCPMGSGVGDDEASARACAAYIERALDDPESGIVKPAAFIIEAVQGEGGVIPANALFLRELRRITEERDILLICDEIQSGWARTGKMFAFEHAGITPDIVTLSKAVGGGLPMALVMYRGALDQWGPGEHAGTFRGNQMAMAVGADTIRYMRDQQLAERAAMLGERLQQRLEALQARHPSIIGQVRGLGLMKGVELVDPAASGSASQPPIGNGALAGRVQNEAFRRGLLIERGGRHGAVVRFLPALTIADDELELLIDLFTESFEASI